MSTSVYYNIKQLLTLDGVKAKDGRKITRDDLGIIENAYIVAKNGKVIEVGSSKKTPMGDNSVDLRGAVVLPCFCRFSYTYNVRWFQGK